MTAITASIAASADASGGGAHDAGQGAQKGGLAGAVAADHGPDLAARQLEVDALQGGAPAVPYRELGDAPAAGSRRAWLCVRV